MRGHQLNFAASKAGLYTALPQSCCSGAGVDSLPIATLGLDLKCLACTSCVWRRNSSEQGCGSDCELRCRTKDARHLHGPVNSRIARQKPARELGQNLLCCVPDVLLMICSFSRRLNITSSSAGCATAARTPSIVGCTPQSPSACYWA